MTKAKEASASMKVALERAKKASAKVNGGNGWGQGGLCQGMGVVLDRANEASAKVKGGYGQGQGELCQGNKEVGLFSMANKLFVIPDSSVTSGKIRGN